MRRARPDERLLRTVVGVPGMTPCIDRSLPLEALFLLAAKKEAVGEVLTPVPVILGLAAVGLTKLGAELFVTASECREGDLLPWFGMPRRAVPLLA